MSAREAVAVVGCHGGAGASTLSRLLHPAMDLALVDDWRRYRRRWWAYPTVLVTRGTAAGTGRAVDQLADALTARLRPAVLVVVADGPWPQPAAARARLRLVSDRVQIVRMPYVARWRYVDDPLDEPVPAKVVAAVEGIRAALTNTGER